MNFQKKNLNILFTVHIVKFIHASLRSIKQKLQTSTVAAETVNNFTDELQCLSYYNNNLALQL